MTTKEEIHDMELREFNSEGEDIQYCIFGCGRILDPDLDHENSCRWCE